MRACMGAYEWAQGLSDYLNGLPAECHSRFIDLCTKFLIAAMCGERQMCELILDAIFQRREQRR